MSASSALVDHVETRDAVPQLQETHRGFELGDDRLLELDFRREQLHLFVAGGQIAPRRAKLAGDGVELALLLGELLAAARCKASTPSSRRRRLRP